MSPACKSNGLVVVGVQVLTQSVHAHLSRDLLLWVRARAEGVQEAAQVWAWDSKSTTGSISLDIGCLKSLTSHFITTTGKSTKAFVCRNGTKILLPECFCYSRVLHLCFHIWKHTSFYLWHLECNKLFLLCNEFLACFSGKITLSSIVLEELDPKGPRLCQYFSYCWENL